MLRVFRCDHVSVGFSKVESKYLRFNLENILSQSYVLPRAVDTIFRPRWRRAMSDDRMISGVREYSRYVRSGSSGIFLPKSLATNTKARARRTSGGQSLQRSESRT